MAEVIENFFHYYSRQGIFTAPKYFASLMDDLPTAISSLCEVTQGLFLHKGWEKLYNHEVDSKRANDHEIRYVLDLLDQIGWRDERPLPETRDLAKRIIGTSRHFAIFLTTLLRHRQIPARVRVGYVNYLRPGMYIEHWVCEYWLEIDRRWVIVDPILDKAHMDALDILFNQFDISDRKFINGGKAWMLLRSGKVPEESFRGFSGTGTENVKGTLLRDFLAFNKLEILPWDGWGLITKEERFLSSTDIDDLTMVATLLNSGDDGYRKLRLMYDTDKRFQMPDRWNGLKKEDW